MKQFLLTEPIFKRLTKKNGGQPPICCYCGQSIELVHREWKFSFNDGLIKITLIKTPEVISLPYGQHGKSKLYHAECYEKTLH